MNKLFKIFLVAGIAVGSFAIADAALAGGGGFNNAEGDISSSTDQAGASSSGDAVGGQVVGVVSAGDASVDSTNRSEDVDIETGQANGFNGRNTFTGQFTDGNGGSINELESPGEISSEVVQASESSTGDGVGGQVIGVVTSAGGSADVVAANTSEDVDIETGESFADNFVAPSRGLGIGQATFNGGGENDAEDDISFEVGQTASAASGDGVGGQVLGIVSAGDASVDATNESTDVDVETGLASADNFARYAVGQENSGEGTGSNFSDGEITAEAAQDSSATSGDAVAGQVAGVVTSAGGSADLVLANTSEDVDAESGESFMFNENEEFVGQLISGGGGMDVEEEA